MRLRSEANLSMVFNPPSDEEAAPSIVMIDNAESGSCA
jgi:hypothetical protein